MKYFGSEIGGKTIADFQQYNPKLERFEDRLYEVHELIYNEEGNLEEFFINYFDTYFDSVPSQTGWLSEQDFVCKVIEGLGTYLLNAKDIQSNRKIKYRFWKSEREFNQYKESENVNTSSMEQAKNDVHVVDMFYSNDDKNFKLATDNKLYAKDIKEVVEIAELEKAIRIANEEYYVSVIEKKIDSILPSIKDGNVKARLGRIRQNVKRYIALWTRDMRDNQLAIKEAIKRPIRFENALKDEEAPDKLDAIDFMEKKHIHSLLKSLDNSDMMSDFGLIVYDLKVLLSKTKLSDRERVVVNMYIEGSKQKEIANAIGVEANTIRTMEKRICEKAVKTYEKQVSDYREMIRAKKSF